VSVQAVEAQPNAALFSSRLFFSGLIAFGHTGSIAHRDGGFRCDNLSRSFLSLAINTLSVFSYTRAFS
jgi:hypothetical protein